MAGASLSRAEAAAALGWWLGAGVDTLVGDTPFAWLDAAAPVVPAAAPPVPATARTTLVTLNVDSLAALAAALAEAHPTIAVRRRHAGCGDGRRRATDRRLTSPPAGCSPTTPAPCSTGCWRRSAARAPTPTSPTPCRGRTTGRDGDALPFLRRQVALARPKAILALGQAATAALTGATAGIARLRGTWLEADGVPVMPTFAPAHLLRQPAHKRQAWADLCAFRARLAA